jgi:hypothetical protein
MRSTILVSPLIVALLTQRAVAQPVTSPAIHRVTMQTDVGVLTITGTGLGSHLLVMVDGQPPTIFPGATDTRLDVQASTKLMTTPGTYRLVVFDPVRQIGDGFVVATAGPSVRPGAQAEYDSSGDNSTSTTEPIRLDASNWTSSASNPSRTAHDPNLAVSPRLFEDPTNTAVGLNALVSNTTGVENTAAGAAALGLNTSGGANTGTGYQALANNTTGGGNTASGRQTLFANTTGELNTATGSNALWSNTTGSNNTAGGAFALLLNRTGSNNTAHGFVALESNTTGFSNTANGSAALAANSSGFNNTATGFRALESNNGHSNTAVGAEALLRNTTGLLNVAQGGQSLWVNTVGHSNTAVGFGALSSNTDGNLNTAFGLGAGSAPSGGVYNVYLGAHVAGTATDANTMRLGLPYDGSTGAGQTRTFIAGIHGTQLTGPAVQVFVDANGQLGTLTAPLVTGGISGGLGVAPEPAGAASATITALRQQVALLQARDTELRTRLARLEAQLEVLAGASRR